MPEEKRVLILEPDPTDAEVIVMQLRKTGLPLNSRRVGTRDMFERVLEEYRPDLVIANGAVPRLDISALIRRHRQEHPRIQWLVVSSAGSEEVAVEALKAGAADYVARKNISRLGPAVRTIFENSPPVAGPHEAAAEAPDLPEPPDVPEAPDAAHLPDAPGIPRVPEAAPASVTRAGADPHTAADFFRNAVESASDLVAVLDLEGKRLYNNPSYADLLDEPDTLEGTSSFVDVHPDDREEVRSVFRETVASGVGQRLEYRLVDREGNIRYIESQGSVVRDAAGKPAMVVIISRDVSRRRLAGEVMRQVQEEIARSRGDEFFPGCVRALAEALGVRYALVSECTDRRRERVRALAYWAAGGPAPVFEYDVAGTTCERVVREGKTTYIAADVQQLFPEEEALRAMDAVAYLGTPLIDAEGGVIGHIFIMHDSPIANPDVARSVLTVAAARAAAELEHRLALRVVSESESLLHALLEEMTAGVILTDMEDVITYVNRPMSELSGFAAPEMLGRLSSTLLIPEEDRLLLYERNERRRSGAAEQYEATLKRKDGTLFRATIEATPHRNARGEVTGTLALIFPAVGHEVRAEEAPSAGTGLLEQAQDAVFVCDPEDRILFWNNAATALYGWAADEVRGKCSAEVLHTEQIHRLGGAAHTTLVEGYWSGELRQRRKDGTMVLVDSRWTLIRDAEGHAKSVLVISTDITGKRELEVYELRAQHMQGIASLASALAADLDGMLTPVMLAVPAVASKADDDPSRQAVAIIATNARRGMETANQVLALAENAGSGKGLLDPSEMLAETSRSVQAALPESIQLETSFPDGLWAIPGTAAQIQQILTNICTNAREAMPDGGVMRIDAENALIEAQSVGTIPHALPGKYLVITVSDTGKGIPGEILGKVFEPFFTTKPAGRTTGLGLSTAAAIARNHRGFINIFSEVGRGTNVKVYLPAEENAGPGTEADLFLGKGKRVIVAQPQASLRDILKKILTAHGYNAVTVRDGSEAIALCRRPGAGIAAAILDLEIPFMDGPAVARILRSINPDVKIIITGGRPGETTEGADALLPTPFSTQNVLGALHDVIEINR
ncbi:MAG TPA: PAS domain S-box protein [Bacteroidota bacterium]|nr:PAS domain S-box protein [Bacteroidota bacterium]